jgi:hypothetical protein
MPLRNFYYQGRDWTVWDTRPGAGELLAANRLSVAEGYREGWLTFQCEVEKRRLVPVPGSWFELTEPQLAALLEAAQPVRREAKKE